MTTSPVAHPGAANSLAGECRRVRGFLARPTLPDRAAPLSGGSLAALLRIYVADIALMSVLAAIAVAVIAMGVDLPETALAGVELSLALAFAIVVVAPIGEEIVFRGWLSGRPGHVLAVALLALGAYLLTRTDIARSDAPVNYTAIALALATLVAAILAPILLRKRGPMGWFARLFPLFFWLSTLAFACVHLLNFDEGALFVLLPLVLPQFVLGALLGYLRVTYGLWASIALHALHNGTAIGIVALASAYAA